MGTKFKKMFKKAMFENDDLVMYWLKEKINKGEYPIFEKTTKRVLEYAEKCLEDLKNRDFSDDEINMELIKDVKKYLKDSNFSNKCLRKENEISENKASKNNYELKTLSDEEIEKIQNLDEEEMEKVIKAESEEYKQLKGKIIQVNRFYNMQLKYVHTARTVLSAEQMLEKMDINNDYIREIILTSAVCHDVGRFYQALEYNSFVDSIMKTDEIFTNNVEEYVPDKNHASAGYYYSMMDLFVMNSFTNDISDKESMLNLIVAFVVRFHQKNNDDMKFLDVENNLEDSENVKFEKLLEIVNNSIYNKSPLLDIEKKHKEYIKKALIDILIKELGQSKESVNELINKIMIKIDKPENEEDYLKEISDFFKKNREKQNVEENIGELAEKLVKILEEELENKNDKISDEKEGKIKNTLIENLKKMIDYDVAMGICYTFSSSEELKQRIVESKIDIRKTQEKIVEIKRDIREFEEKLKYTRNVKEEDAILKKLKQYNSEKGDLEEELKQKMKTRESLEELNKRENSEEIEKYKLVFSIPFNFITDADKIDILNQRALGTYPTNCNPEYLPVIISEEYMIYEDFFEKMGIKEEDKEKIKGIERDEENKNNDLEKILKKGDVVQVPKEYVYKYYNSGKKDSLEPILRKVDEENFFKYNGMERQGLGPIRALLWTMNQFIITNMRTKSSFEIIKENKFIERIYQNYPEEIKEIIKPYMEYMLFFIDQRVKEGEKIYTAKIMKENAEQTYEAYKNISNEEKKKYAERLDENRNREDGEEFNY